MHERPVALTPDKAGIPEELTKHPQWVLWRYEYRAGGWTKPPFQASGKYASHSDPKSWSEFSDIWSAYRSGEWDGIGFVLSKDDEFIGIDIDHCSEGFGRTLSETAQKATQFFTGTHIELSPSANGIRIFIRARMPDWCNQSGIRSSEYGIEVYSYARYLTITGARLSEEQDGIRAYQSEFEQFLKEFFPQFRESQATSTQARALPLATETDEDLVSRIRRSASGELFSRLYDSGDLSGYDGNHSSADLALCNLLVWWCSNDIARADRIFRRSALMRTKWDEPRGDGTYGSRTLERAAADCTGGYNPTAPLLLDVDDPHSDISATIDPDRDPHAKALAGEALNDDGNGIRLTIRHGANLRFTVAKGWYTWDGKRWTADPIGAELRAKHTARHIHHEALYVQDEEAQKKRLQWARQSGDHRRIVAMLSCARSEPRLSLAYEAFNANPMLLNCKNGIVDLSTGELKPHERRHYITQIADITYDSEAKSAEWERFLDEVTLGDTEYQAFLQRAVGYSLTGDTSEEKLFLIHGPGGSGKSTFLEAVRCISGDYYRQANFETFLLSQNPQAASNGLAALVHARIVVSSEVEDGRKLAAALVKMITGRDPVTARFLYQEFFTFVPSFKLWLVTNHAPGVSENDAQSGTWRRILRLPFEYVPAQRDPELKTRLTVPLAARQAVLAWAVEGALLWRRYGLNPPASVLSATEALREEGDIVGNFLLERCITTEAAAWTPTNVIWHAYSEWCQERGIRYTNSRWLGRELAARGVKQVTKRVGASFARGWQLAILPTSTQVE